MTIVVHLGKFYPPDKGGIESVTATLARGAAAAGMATTVLCFEEIGRGDALDCGVVVRRLPAIKLSSQPLSLAYFRQALKLARRADIVHVHLPNMVAALAVAILGAGPKVVLHWHSDVVDKGLLARLLGPLERLMLRRADKVICTSKAYADASMALRSVGQKVEVVPIGVPDLSPICPANQAGLQTSLSDALQRHINGRPLVLAVGRLVPYKGFSVLVNAAQRLAADAAIVIVGGGPLDGALQRQIDSLGAGGRVVLAGRVDDATLSALLGLAAVFCMPSVERSEAFGVSLVEAMARGLPAVATRIPGSGVPWVNQHGESGLNVTPGDPVDLAAALDLLLGDAALRTRLGFGARARYQRLFTEDRFVADTLDLYKRALVQG